MIHVWQLKKYIKGRDTATENLAKGAGEGVLSVQPQSNTMMVILILWGTLPIKQVLIQWKSIPPEECTWENYKYIQQQFSNLNIEVKVDAQEEYIISKPFKIYCKKRGKMKKYYKVAKETNCTRID